MRTWRAMFFAFAVALIAATGCNFLAGGGDPNGDDDGNGNGDGNVNENLVEFTNPDDPFFTTTDVRDVDDEIVNFDMETNSIVWAADGTSYQAGLWTVNGNLLAGGQFQVRFGTDGGVKKAYFTETGPATICQIRILGGQIAISATSVQVPND